MGEIKSKIHNYGDENESEWPPRFPKRSAGGFRGYWDSEQKKFIEGRPQTIQERKALNDFTSDTIDPTQSMINRKHYTSKTKLRRHYKDHGKREVGNDYLNATEPRDDTPIPPAEDDIREAKRQIQWGEAKNSEYTKYLCKLNDQILKRKFNP